MTNDELYLKISQLIDTAFKEQESRDEAMEGRLNHRMDILESRMDRMDIKMDHVEASLGARIDSLDAKIDHVEASLNAKIDAVNESLSGKIQAINLKLENEIIPNYKEIKNCYISTSLRYQENTGKMECMQIDIDVLKSVVGKHEQMLCGVPA